MTITRSYPAAIDDVWDACTRPERVIRWLLPLSGDLRAGGRYQLEGNAGGTIERCEPPTGLSVTWEYGGEISWVDLSLSAQAVQVTRLKLAHTVAADDKWAQFGPGAVGPGWDLPLIVLGSLLSTGDSGPPAVDAEVIRVSTQRWQEAHLAGGAPPDEARAAGERSTDFWLALVPDDC